MLHYHPMPRISNEQWQVLSKTYLLLALNWLVCGCTAWLTLQNILPSPSLLIFGPSFLDCILTIAFAYVIPMWLFRSAQDWSRYSDLWALVPMLSACSLYGWLSEPLLRGLVSRDQLSLIWIAAGGMLIFLVALSIFAFYARSSSRLYGLGSAFTLTAMSLWILTQIFDILWLELVSALLFIVLASSLLIANVQRLAIGQSNPIQVALQLFVNTYSILIYLLRILMMFNRPHPRRNKE